MYSLNISDFNVSEEVGGILYEERILDPLDIIYTLEIYKFLTRGQIISVLRDKFPKVNIQDIDRVGRDPDFADIESKHDIIIDFVDGKTVNVVKSIFHDVDIVSLDLDLYRFTKYNVINVTELNYRELRDSDFRPNYDPMILFKRILLEVIQRGGTDLHFNVKHVDMETKYPIQYRQGADLLDLDLFELDSGMNKDIITKLVGTKTLANAIDLTTADGITANSSNIFGNNNIELRIAANKVKGGLQCVVRIQEKKTFSFTIESLGFPEHVQSYLHQIAKKRSGITLITGAIRTGKNTTAFALANEMVKYPIKIIDYSSPIEVLMPFTQVDYLADEGNLLSCVRLAKKQDINVAFINEIPSKEVAFAVKDLANSSIHVITTLHLDRIWHLPYKLVEYYGNSYKDVISQINGVVNQKMFDIACPHCKKKIPVSELSDKRHVQFLKDAGIDFVNHSVGCPECKGTGSVQGKSQPYVEYIYFDGKVKSKLLACNQPWEMELVIAEAIKDQSSLEQAIITGITEDKLDTKALDFIL